MPQNPFEFKPDDDAVEVVAPPPKPRQSLGTCEAVRSLAMPSVFECPNPKCGRRMTVPDHLLGREVDCPECDEEFVAGPPIVGTKSGSASTIPILCWVAAGFWALGAVTMSATAPIALANGSLALTPLLLLLIFAEVARKG